MAAWFRLGTLAVAVLAGAGLFWPASGRAQRRRPLPSAPPATQGSATAVFAERSAFSDIDDQLARCRWNADAVKKDAQAALYDIAGESFQVYVPKSYEPGVPFGLLVYVSDTNSGAPPAQWTAAADSARLIWVSANGAGASRKDWDRCGLAIDAIHNLKKLYTIDDERVYVAGEGPAANLAGNVAMAYPDMVQGVLFIQQCGYFRPIQLPRGAVVAASFGEPPGDLLSLARKRSRVALVVGDRDAMRQQSQTRLEMGYRQGGFAHAACVEIAGLRGRPDAAALQKGIAALDAPLGASVKELFDRGGQLEAKGDFGAALAAYTRVTARTAEADVAADALARSQLIRRRYRDLIDKARSAIDQSKFTEAAGILQVTVKQYGDSAASEARSMLEQLRTDPQVLAALKEIQDKIAWEKYELQAARELEAVRESLPQDLLKGYRALRLLARRYEGTLAGARAAAEAAELWGDPAKRREILAGQPAAEAQSLLAAARTYAASGQYAGARNRLERLLTTYPDTPAAKEAAKLLAQWETKP